MDRFNLRLLLDRIQLAIHTQLFILRFATQQKLTNFDHFC